MVVWLCFFLMWTPPPASGDPRFHHLTFSKPRQDASAETSTSDTQTWSFVVTSVLGNHFRSQCLLVSSVPMLPPSSIAHREEGGRGFRRDEAPALTTKAPQVHFLPCA